MPSLSSFWIVFLNESSSGPKYFSQEAVVMGNVIVKIVRFYTSASATSRMLFSNKDTISVNVQCICEVTHDLNELFRYAV